MTQQLISPIDLRDFAKSLGWELLNEGIADRLFVLRNPNSPRRQLTFPMDMTAPDYTESTYRVIEKLGEILNEPPQSLMMRVHNVRDDTLRFRIFSDHCGSSLPLGFTTSLVSGVQQLLKTAACTVMRPLIHHPRLALSEAQQLIEKSRFEHTEPGSFVFRVSCPIHALDVQGMLFTDHEDFLPFVRRVTLALKRAMEQLIGAIEGDTLVQFVDSQKKEQAPLLSSNLCEALTKFYDEAIDNSLDVSFDWSALEPVKETDKINKNLRFQRDYFGRIEEVRRELRSLEGHLTQFFIGTVERLSGEMGEDGNRSGEVIFNLLQEGESVRAKATLEPKEYSEAIIAHKTNGAYVLFYGKIQPGRQPRQIIELSQFRLLLPNQEE